MRLVNLALRYHSKIHTNMLILVDDDVQNPEKAMKKVVIDFLSTKEGKEAMKRTIFGWVYAINIIPKEVWAKHGIQFVPTTVLEDYDNLRDILKGR